MGAYGEYRQGILHLQGMIGEPESGVVQRNELTGPASTPQEAEALGKMLAQAFGKK